MTKNGGVMIDGIRKPVSKLALGTAFYRLEDKDVCFRLLDCFLAEGGTVIDSARHYGESEPVIAFWLESRGVRERVVLITKGGHGKGYGLTAGDFAPTIEREITDSLERLKTDYVDLYMLHRDSPAVPVAKIMDCLNRELDRGRIRTIGASNWQYPRVVEANEYARKFRLKGFSAVSNNLSLAVPAVPFYPGLVWVDRTGERWHEQTRLPIIVWSSQARGFFSGCYTPEMCGATEQSQDPDTRRMVEVYCTDDNFRRRQRAVELGRKKGGYSATQIALAWLLHKPFPTVPIIGPHSRKELVSCIKATRIKLTRAETKWLNLEDENG